MPPVRSRLGGLVASNFALKRVGASWFLVNLAEWAYVTVVAIHAYELYGATGVGLIGARFAPGALFGSVLIGGVTRFPPALVLRAVSLGRCAAVAAAAVALAGRAPLAVLVAIVWIDAVVGTTYRPVQSTILPALASTPSELSAVAGSVPVSKALAQAAGALAGSVALSLVAPEAVAAVSAGTFLLTAAVISSVHVDAPLVVEPATAEDGQRRSERFGAIGVGIELIARRARPLLVLGGARSLTRGLWATLAVIVSIRLLHLGSSGVGILMAAAGVGAAVAVPLSLRLAGRPRLAGPAALMFALAGLPLVLVGAIPVAGPAVAFVAVWGTALALSDSISNALVHRVVEARRLAPSIAAIESSKLLLEGLGALAAPALLAVMGIRYTLIAAGAILPLLVLVSRSGLLVIDERAEARQRPLSALRRTPSFRGLTMLSLESLAARLRDITVAAGSTIVREGEVGDRFYLVDSGRVEVTIDGFPIVMLGPEAGVGEKALLRATPRSASVTALERCRMWYLDSVDFVAAATGEEGLVARPGRRSMVSSLEDALDPIPLFAGLDWRELAAAGESISGSSGEEIVREGDPGDRFYVLLEGELEVTRPGRSLQRLEPGDWFGEIALLHRVPRRATVTAITPVKLWTLARDPFLAALGKATALNAPTADTANGELGLAGAGLLV